MIRVKIEDTNVGSAFTSLFMFNHKVVSDKTSQQIRLVYAFFSDNCLTERIIRVIEDYLQMITLILDHAYYRMWSLKVVFNSLGNHVPTLATQLNLKSCKTISQDTGCGSWS